MKRIYLLLFFILLLNISYATVHVTITNPTTATKTVCQGDVINFTCIVTGATGSVNYQWKNNYSIVDNNSYYNYTATTISNTYYKDTIKVIVINVNTAEIDSAQVIITVNQRPVANFSVSPVSQTICSGKNVIFANLATQPTGATASWDFAGATNSPTSSSWSPGSARYWDITGNIPLIKSCKLIVTLNGCKDSMIKDITVYPPPSPILTSNKRDTLCKNEFATYHVSGYTGSSYVWSASPSGLTINSGTTTDSFAIKATNVGTYTLTLTETDINGCTSSKTKTILVYDSPTAAFIIGSNNVCSNNTINFTNNSLPSGVSYKWNFGDTLSPEIKYKTQNSYTYDLFGISNQSYDVWLIVSNQYSCRDSIKQVLTLKGKPDASLKSDETGGFINSPTVGVPTTIIKCSSTIPTHQLTLTNLSTTLATNINYNITFETGSVYNSGGASFGIPSHTYPNTGSFTLTNAVTGQNGCIATKQYTVYIGAAPGGSISIPANNVGLCAPQTFNFPLSSVVLNNSPNTKYQFTFNDGSPTVTYDQSQLTSLPFLNNGGNIYFPHTFSNASCGYLSTSFSNSFNIKLNISNGCQNQLTEAQPIVLQGKTLTDFNMSQAPYCLNSSITLTDNSLSSCNLFYNGADYISYPSGTISKTWLITPSTYTILSGSLTSSPLVVSFNQIGSYSIKYTTNGQNSCGDGTITKTIHVSPLPVPVFSMNKSTFCLPDTVQITNTTDTTNYFNIPTYTWAITCTNTGCGTIGCSGITYVKSTTVSSRSPYIRFSQPGVYTITLTVNNGCYSVTSTPQTITVKDKPYGTFTATTPVCQNATICVNTVNVATCYSSTTPTYVWTSTLGTFPTPSSQLPGCITATTTGTNTISLALTNECGVATYTNNIVVNPFPVITSQITTACSGVAFTVTPANSPPTVIVPTGTTYTWSAPVINPIGALTGDSAKTVGVTSISQTLTNLTTSPATATYTVNSTVGSCPGNSFTLTVTVNPKPYLQPQTASICSGGTFSVVPLNAPPTMIVPPGTTYKWSAPVISPTGSITGGSAQTTAVSSISQTLTNTTANPATATYTVTPTSGSNGTCAGATFTVTVTVNPTPLIPAITTSICTGTAFNVAPITVLPGTLVPSGTTYTWTAPIISPAGTLTGGSAQTTIMPSVSQVLTNSSTYSASAVYTVTPSVGGFCQGNSFIVTVIVNPAPVIPAQTVSICSGTSFIVSPTNNPPTSVVPAGTTYTWSAPYIDPPGSLAGGTAQLNNVTSISQQLTNTTINSSTATYTVIPKVGGDCPGSAFLVTVIVNSAPIVPAQMNSICSGATFSLTPTTNLPSTIVPTGTTYTWASPVINPPLVITGGYPQPTGVSSINIALTNTTVGPATASYTIVPKVGNCQGGMFTLNLNVNPTPVVPSQSATICSGDTFRISPSNNPPNTLIPVGTVYTWTNPVITPSGAIIGGSDQLAGVSTISQTLTNITNYPATATYTVTPISALSGNCPGTPFLVTVNVNPAPIIPNQFISTSSGTTFIANPINNPPTCIVPTGTNFTWTTPVVSPLGTISGANAQPLGVSTISLNLSNTTASQSTVTYSISSIVGSCAGLPYLLTVTVNPLPVIPSQTKTICSSDTFQIIPFNNPPTTIVPFGTTYTWGNPIYNPAGSCTGGSAQTTGVTFIKQSVTNITSGVATATFTVVPHIGSYTGNSFTITVTVLPASVIIPNKTDTICTGETYTYVPLNAPPTAIVPAGTTYTWGNPVINPPGAITGATSQPIGDTLFSQTLINTTNNTAIVTYNVITNPGVSATCAGNPFTITLYVDPIPIVETQYTNACSGLPFTIYPPNNPPNSVIPYGTMYKWDAPVYNPIASLLGGSADTTGHNNIGQTLTDTTNSPAIATYSVTPYYHRCKGNPFDVIVTINNIPAAAGIITGATTICRGTKNVYYSVDTIAGALAYIWTLPVGASGNSTSNYIYVDYSSTAISGSISVKGYNFCMGLSSSLNVTLKASPPVPVVTRNGNVLTSSSNNGNQWYEFATGFINNATAPSFIPQQNGTYFVIVTLNGCSSDTSNKVIISNVGINTIKEENMNLKVMPNPFTDKTTFTYTLAEAEHLRLSITDLMGREIKVLNDSKQDKGEHKIIFDASTIPTGIYFYKISAGAKETVGKLILTK